MVFSAVVVGNDYHNNNMKHIIDLTIPIREGMSVWPGDPIFRSEKVACLEWDGYAVSSWTIGSHLGTHLDAPCHFFADGETFNGLSLHYFFGSAALINLAAPVREWSKNHRTAFSIGLDLLLPFESLFQKVERILIRTDWSLKKEDPEYWMTFPSFTPDAVDWIADYPIRILGLETPSLCAFPILKKEDGIRSSEEQELLDELTIHADSECHRILLGRRPPILLLEGLCNLDQLPDNFDLSCFPLPIESADGSPVRAIAMF